MTTLSAAEVRLAAFGDLDAELWGVVWSGVDTVTIGGSLSGEPAAVSASLDADASADEWRLVGDGLELVLAGSGLAVNGETPNELDQLCEVRGEVTRYGAPHSIECRGRRAVRVLSRQGEPRSLRDFSAWFAPDDGAALSAWRAANAVGHEHDVITAALFEPTGAARVTDPRFSTTYGADGAPSRVGLELWIEEEEEADSFPRRLAGQALTPPASGAAGSVQLQARAFQCFAHGLRGLGVYLLAHQKDG